MPLSDEAAAFKDKGNGFFREENYQNALDNFDKAIELAPEEHTLWSNKYGERRAIRSARLPTARRLDSSGFPVQSGCSRGAEQVAGVARSCDEVFPHQTGLAEGVFPAGHCALAVHALVRSAELL